jgi:hypothetical protein
MNTGAMEVVHGYVVKPSSTFTTVTAFTGDSFTVRNSPKNAYLMNVWSAATTSNGGGIQITSPRLHDNSRGIKLRNHVDSNFPLLPIGFSQPLVSQDTLQVQMTGANTTLLQEVICLDLYYPELPGTQQRLIDPQTVQSRFVNYETIEVSVTAGTTAGAYATATAINATYDNLKANTDYAILGGSVTIPATSTTGTRRACTICLRGTDTGNLRIGFPNESIAKSVSREWFYLKSFWYKIPLIPVFNSANKANTYLDIANGETALTQIVSLHCAELRT